MSAIKNIVVGLFAIIGLVIAGFLIYGIGGLIIGLIGLVVSVVVAVAPIVLGVASAIFLVVGGAYAIGKAIREGGK